MSQHPNLYAIRPPYDVFTFAPELSGSLINDRGVVLLWNISERLSKAEFDAVVSRPWSTPLIAVLPRSSLGAQAVLELLEDVRPRHVFPNSKVLTPKDVVEVLRTEPEDLPGVVLDLFSHTRLLVDRDTRRFISKTIEFSNRVRSLSELCRQLYVSRRALGRRFFDRQLPPPSHWLQFSRALRVCLRLQSSRDPVASIAGAFGYPDAFTLSNQLVRLIGARPSDVRECLGWEWLVEAWVERERTVGYFPLVEPLGLQRPRQPPTRPTGHPMRERRQGALV